MKVFVNNKEVETCSVTLAALVLELSVPTQGLAVAVANRIIPRDDWDGFHLKENEQVMVISATRGG